ncbi:protein kinase [Pelomyxa schiedti]|nr:protein kinase [Pelomyxa schiedti]
MQNASPKLVQHLAASKQMTPSTPVEPPPPTPPTPPTLDISHNESSGLSSTEAVLLPPVEAAPLPPTEAAPLPPVSPSLSTTPSPPTSSTPTTSTKTVNEFGRTLANSVLPGTSVPYVIEQCITHLTSLIQSNALPLDIFSPLPPGHEPVTALKANFEVHDGSSSTPSPLSTTPSLTPQVIATVLLTYLQQLPHPLLPGAYYYTALRIACIPCEPHRLHQIRVLITKLPSIPRATILRLCSFLSSSKIPLPVIISLFTPLILRQQHQQTTHTAPEEPQLHHEAAQIFVRLILENMEFMSLQVQIDPVNESEYSFLLKGKAQQDQKGNDVILDFKKGDLIHLIAVYKEGWLEGVAVGAGGGLGSGTKGLVPVPSIVLMAVSESIPLPGLPSAVKAGPEMCGKQVSTPLPEVPTPVTKEEVHEEKKKKGFLSGLKSRIGGKKDAPTSSTTSGTTTTTPTPTPTAALPTPTTTAATPPSLPPGWKEGFDPANRKAYYINMYTRKAQWVRPTAPAGPGTIDPAQQKMMMMQQQQQMVMMQQQQLLLAQQQQMLNGGMVGVNPGMTMGMLPGATVDAALQEKMEALHMAEVEMEKRQEALKKKEEHLEAQRRVDQLARGGQKPNWQIEYSEIELLNQIGEGGFGKVFRGRWRGTEVAVKTLKGGEDASVQEVAVFSKEVSILRSLHHPQLVLFLGACLSPVLAMVSEFMTGGSLYDLLYKSRILPNPIQRQVYALDIAKAMAYLHNCRPPIIHRDLKSANILLDEKGEHAKVCDVGLARVKSDNVVLTGAVGTFAWMPPEMMKGLQYDERVDVYSYGLILYELVTATIPFAGLNPTQIQHMIATLDQRPPLPFDLSPKWSTLIQTCWATDMTLRPPFMRIIDTLPTINM